MFKSFSNYIRYVRTVNELEQMSDRQLYDLGITRFDIRRVAKGHSR